MKSKHTQTILGTLAIIALSSIFISSAIAADEYQYTGKGVVTFNHAEHGKKIDCATCHKGTTPEKIMITNKKQGHDQCLTCHKAEKAKGNTAAPTSCKQCHQK